MAAEPSAPPARHLEPVPTVIAILLIVAYAALMLLLVALRGDTHWDRLAFLFNGFEAVAFAAAGWLFGTTVQRSRVEDAKSEAARARQDAGKAQVTAEAVRKERDQTKTAAERGEALSQAIKAKRAAFEADRLGARPSDEPIRPELAEILDLAQRLFPD